MSTEFEEVRKLAVEIAKIEVTKNVKEVTAINRGPEIDKYITRAKGTANLDDLTERGSEWCGMFVYYCFSEAANRLGKTLPFRAGNLHSGRKVRKWSEIHTETLVTTCPILPGDIYVTNNNHIGLAIGSLNHEQVFKSIDGNQVDHGNRGNSLREKTQTFSNMQLFVRI